MRVSPTTRYVFRRHPACIHRVITEVIKCSFWLPRFTTACSSVPHKNVAQPLEIQPLEMKAGEQSAQSVITHASRDLERKFRSLADNSPDMIVRYDCNLRRTYVNRAWQNVTGISDAAALNHSPVELPGLMNAKAAAYEAKLRAVVLSGLPLNMEVTQDRADATQIYLERRIIPEFDADGRVESLLSITRDITERRKNEDMLRIAAAAFETHEAIVITDVNARIIRVNRAFQDITGYSADEVQGRNPSLLSAQRHEPAFYAQMWDSIHTRGSWTGELWSKRKNGELYPKWMTITAVKDARSEVTQYVGIFSDISEQKRAQESIVHLAFYDSLTQLPNRRLLLDHFDRALAHSTKTGLYGAVLYLDLDRFKLINDSFGHNCGDLLLMEVTQRIRAGTRSNDTVARLGGDEFVILIEGVGTEHDAVSHEVARIAEEIRYTLAQPYTLKDRVHHSSPSIGVCLFNGANESVEALLKYADIAMYQAKDAGRNAVRFYDPLMQQAVDERLAIESDLRTAIALNQFSLYYQVQVDDTKRPLGAEALIRWQHPIRGLVPPVEFIPVAEESSLILDIGNWVLETACRQLVEWSRQEATQSLELAVNVSAQQFRQPDFASRMIALLDLYRFDASLLKLELTESVMLDDVSDVTAKMHALKALGVKLSLDDFGTGYSSLSYLRRLPLDQLKIDKSFIRQMTVEARDATLVRTIIDMAKNFGLNVIAEGVETEAQMAFLKLHDCMTYQGYLFSKPLPLDEFSELIAAHWTQHHA